MGANMLSGRYEDIISRSAVFTLKGQQKCVRIWPVRKDELSKKLSLWFDGRTKSFILSTGFAGNKGQMLPLQCKDGSGISGWLFGVGEGDDPFIFGLLPGKLPPAIYKIESDNLSKEHYLGWGLGSYKFNSYKGNPSVSSDASAVLCVDNAAIKSELDSLVSSIFLGRDLINTPSNDLGPLELADCARALAERFGASCRFITGSDLYSGFPLVHAVGRAAANDRDPLVVDLNWSPSSQTDASGSNENSDGATTRRSNIALVGKGVCFDTGGLDIKPPTNMVTMKKDMGGAACVLSLASMIMQANLDVNLRVVIPVVENSISSNAFRPSDVIRSRSGLTVEVGNTDAEGRLILADCLTAVTEETSPSTRKGRVGAGGDTPVFDLVVDMATLTGAHRVALGWDLPGIFTDNDAMANDIYVKGMEHNDPVWRLPLWQPYEKLIESKVADVHNIGSVPWGGAITAALFLKRFVQPGTNWMHVDLNGWTRERPGFPEGGEPQASRAIFEYIKEKAHKGSLT